ncbi:MAG: hypothetical protein U5L45_18320 [Saprospiraceae bacterium]|nr:hypothetical protein [Saprospiraceae bacterium]
MCKKIVLSHALASLAHGIGSGSFFGLARKMNHIFCFLCERNQRKDVF